MSVGRRRPYSARRLVHRYLCRHRTLRLDRLVFSVSAHILPCQLISLLPSGAFYWIPNAALSAVIIHAVLDLIASPRQVYAFWKCSPLECLIFILAVLVSVFSCVLLLELAEVSRSNVTDPFDRTIEIGIYTSVGASVALLLFRIARPRGAFLGRVRIRPDIASPPSYAAAQDGSDGATSPVRSSSPPLPPGVRDVYLPLLPDGVRNPLVQVDPPPPGIIVFRFEESFIYPNASMCKSSKVTVTSRVIN